MKNVLYSLVIFWFSGYANAQNLPEFEIYNVSGQKVLKDSLLKAEKITMVNFWATWCPNCIKEMMEINKVLPEFNNVQFISVNIDSLDFKTGAKAFFDKRKFLWTLYLDPQKNLYSKVLEVTENTDLSLPMSIVISKTGQIIRLRNGFIQENFKAELIEDIKSAEE